MTTLSVTVSALLGPRTTEKAGRPVTVTNQGAVAKLVKLFNDLPVYSGPACMPVFADGIRLVFRDASGHLLGAAVAPIDTCTVQLSLAGKGDAAPAHQQ